MATGMWLKILLCSNGSFRTQVVADLQQQNSGGQLQDLNNSSALTTEGNEKRKKFELSIVCFIFITKLTWITSETVGDRGESKAKGLAKAHPLNS